MEFLYMVAFAAALSLDGFGVGVAYGMRKIKIPFLSLVVISLTSATGIGITMYSGHLVSQYLSVKAAEITGAAILIGVGLWILFQTWTGKGAGPEVENTYTAGPEPGTEGKTGTECKPILNLRIRAFGLVIQIMREPTVADIDKSGNISTREALLLGLALAMDALGAGFGAAMTGFTPLLTPAVVGTVKFIMVSVGVHIGRRYAVNWLGDRAAVLPGWVLILLGVARVIKA